MHSSDTDNGAETSVLAERGNEVRRQVAHRVGADYSGGLRAYSIQRVPKLLNVVDAAPRALIPYADVVHADVVMHARCGDEISLVLHIVTGKVGSVANPARHALE